MPDQAAFTGAAELQRSTGISGPQGRIAATGMTWNNHNNAF